MYKSRWKIIRSFKTLNIVFKAVFLFIEYPFFYLYAGKIYCSFNWVPSLNLRPCLSQLHRIVISSVFLQHFLHYPSPLTPFIDNPDPHWYSVRSYRLRGILFFSVSPVPSNVSGGEQKWLSPYGWWQKLPLSIAVTYFKSWIFFLPCTLLVELQNEKNNEGRAAEICPSN